MQNTNNVIADEALIGLVRRAQAGDTAAFNGLVGRFQDRAVGYAFRLLCSRPDAEDAAQDAFVQLFRDLPRLRNPDRAEVYLRRMVFKYCDRRRRALALRTVPLDDRKERVSGDEPFAALWSNERRQAVARALAALPPSQQPIARLRYESDLSLTEIAEQVALPVGTIKNRLHAARKRLRKELWEMADEILMEKKPSDTPAFSGQVLAQILTEFAAQMRTDPHLANRALLEQARSGLDTLLRADTPPDFTTARYGFDLLLKQDDWKSAAALLLRFLDGDGSDSQIAWAYLDLANALAMSDQPAGAVLAHQAFEKWIPGKEPRLSPHCPNLPVGVEEPSAYDREDVRLLMLSRSAEFAYAYVATGRLSEYLSLVDARLMQASQKGAGADLRFYGLWAATMACCRADDFARAHAYINRMHRLADALPSPHEQSRWRLRTYGDHLALLLNEGNSAQFAARATEMRELLDEQVQQGNGDEVWVRCERHNLADRYSSSGRYADALPLWEENARGGGQLNDWGYLLHAGAVWQETGDRPRTLSLLRDAAAHADREVTEMFQERPEFATVRQDLEFLAAVKRPT